VADVIPVFPLSHVLVPGMPLPLHIFEPRYRQLLQDVQQGPGQSAFGIIALRSGGEVDLTPPGGAPPDIAEVGTLAEILEVEPFDDGASDLLTVGSRRFRIRDVITEGAPYLRARVEWVEERTGTLRPHEVAVTHRLCRQHAELLEALTGRERDSDLPRDPNLLSYHVAAQLPLAPNDRQALLEQPTAGDRLRLAVTLLRREISLLEFTRSICVAPGVLQLAAHPN
jgi:Lon protease-like protein